MCGKQVFLGVAVMGLLLGGVSLSAAEGGTADEEILRRAGIGTDDATLLRFFRQRTPHEEEIRSLIKKLDDDDYQIRENATRDLINLGPATEPFLREALRTGDPEVTRRAEECLRKIRSGPSAEVIAAAVRLLAKRKPAEAREVFLAYPPKEEGDTTEEEMAAVLRTMALRNGKPDPVFVAALRDESANKRTAAAVALAHAGAGETLPAIRRLLEDKEVTVRLRVGLALAERKEKEAVPVLIDLLPRLKGTRFGTVEDLLFRLAEDQAPDPITETDPETCRRYRDAWAAWWRKQGEKISLDCLERPAPFRGYTMMVLLDAGRIMEVNADRKMLWQIDNLDFPLDAQMLPGERILVAEYKGNRVTERNRKGEILWKKDLEGPLMAQRLPNRSTLIATRYQLLEIDRAGKQVFRWMCPEGTWIMKAQKQPGGDMGLVLGNALNTTSTFVRLNALGREVASFAVAVRTSGGRVEMLANGHVLLPLKDENKVVEYDAQGKEVWQANSPDPVAAVRLANGHTLITAYQSQQAVEVDGTGKEVWKYQADARLTRAWRR